MNFNPVEYMEWAKLVPPAAINLSRSGMPVPEWEELGVDFGSLKLYGDHPYGYPPLLEAIAARAGTHPDNVIPVCGTSQALFLAAAVFLRPGDSVIVERPAYEPLLSSPRALGAEIVRIERTFENGFNIDWDGFEAALVRRPKLVFLTNLHNPSGAYLERGDIAAAAETAARFGAHVFVDEVYLEFLDKPGGRTAFGSADNVLVGSSLTKAYGLAGLRCGWILVPPRLRGVFRHAVDHLFVENVFMAEQMAARIFPNLDRLRERNRGWIEENRRRVSEFMAEEPGLDWVAPAGGIIGFPRTRGAKKGDDLARVLKERFDTSVVPGRFFEAPAHFRLGFGVPRTTLERGLDSIRAALSGLG